MIANRSISDLLKGVALTSVGSIVTVGFHFLSILLLTRYVQKDVLGLYFLALAVVQVLKIISGLGLDLTLSKFVSGGDKQLQRDSVASTVVVRFISVIVVGLLYYGAGRLILPTLDARLINCSLTVVLLLALTSYRDLFLGLMQGTKQFKEYAVVEVVSAVARVVLLIALRHSLSLQVLLYIEIIAQLVEVLLQLFAMRGFLLTLSLENINRGALEGLRRFSIPLYINNLLAVVHDRGSVFMIGAFLSPASVAAYEVARKVPDGFSRLFDSFIVVYFPSLSSLFSKGNRDEAKRLMCSSLALVSAGMVLLVLVAFLFANEIVRVLFSEKYLEVSLAFALLMLNLYLRSLSNILGYSLVSAGHSSAPVKANIVAVAVNIVSSLVLIQRFGYVGAVYSLLIMNILTQIIYELLLRRAQLAPHLLAYLKPIGLLAAAITVYHLIGTDSSLLKVLLLGLYIGACWLLMKEVRASSRSALAYISGSRAGTLAWQAFARVRGDLSKR